MKATKDDANRGSAWSDFLTIGSLDDKTYQGRLHCARLESQLGPMKLLQP